MKEKEEGKVIVLPTEITIKIVRMMRRRKEYFNTIFVTGPRFAFGKGKLQSFVGF